jgi:hypothetical protein
MADKKQNDKRFAPSKKPNENITGSFLEYPIENFTPTLNASSPARSYSMPSPVIPSAIPPQSMPNENVIRNTGLRVTSQEPEDDSNTNFLGSLIAQGVAGIGTGLMGGSPRDLMNSANMFQYMRDQQTKRNKSDLLMDPKSEESKKRRLVFKNLGYDVPENLSYTDLGDSDVLRSLRSKQMEQPKLAGMTRGGGVGQGKSEKESKEQVEANKTTAQANSLKNKLIEYREAVKQIPNPIFGGAAQKARAESLKSDILLMIKDVNKTGALDIGSVEVIEQKIGTPDYTRNEVIDSRINQTLKSLNDDVESKMKGANTINKFYIPYESNEIDFTKE